MEHRDFVIGLALLNAGYQSARGSRHRLREQSTSQKAGCYVSLYPIQKGKCPIYVVFPTCCGVDVHKSFLVATIIKTPKDSLQPGYQKKRFSTFNSDLNRFADWLHLNDCLDVCMESAGKYWVPVFNILEKCGIRIVIANPKWVRAVNVTDAAMEVGYESVSQFIRDYRHMFGRTPQKDVQEIRTCMQQKYMT